MRMYQRRRGFALAVALAAIVVIGGLIAGIFFASTQEYRIGRNTILQSRALTAAEYGINRTLMIGSGGWNQQWNTTASPGVIATVGYTPSDGSLDTVRIINLTHGNFLVTSTGMAGTVGGAQARRRVAQLVALAMPTLNMVGALTTRGSTKIGGSSFIDGTDDTIPNWSCPPGGSGMPAIGIDDSTKIDFSGCKNQSCLSGSPKIAQTPVAAADSTYTQFGDVSWDQLTAMADKRIPSGATLSSVGPTYLNGACNYGDLTNWGDPLRTGTACVNYFPIIYAQGDLQMTGGAGQGILIVEGNLSVSGGFQFYGPVIVKGSLKTTGTGGHFNGGVMAGNVDFAQNTILGNAVVNFSRCALTRALSGSAKPGLSRGRSWMELP
jgi:hypothetical protein